MTMRQMPPPRPELAHLPPSIHGARDYRVLAKNHLAADDVLDFSSNANPYGAPPAVLDAVRAAVAPSALKRYPDRDCLALRAAISRHTCNAVDALLPGNGTAELIQTIALAYVQSGSRHVILAPTFGEYARAVQLAGGQVVEMRPSSPDFRFDPDAVARELRRLKPAGVWLCNPNNPTGEQWSAEVLARVRQATPQALWVVDEAYRHFATAPVTAEAAPNTIILRSLTKDFSLAGLRLGYLIAHPTVIGTLKTVQPPWSVNTLAQIAGVAAFQPESLAWRQRTLTQLRRHAAQLWDDLRALGMTVLSTETTFALVQVDDAAKTHRQLLARRILVRDATSFGLPHHIRIAARHPAENRRLVTALKAVSDIC